MAGQHRKGGCGVFVLGIIGVIALLVSLVACGSDAHKDAPQPATSNITDAPDVKVWRLPNGFRNIAFFCLNGNGVYETSRGEDGTTVTASSIDIVPNDAACQR